MRWEKGGRTASNLLGSVSNICSKLRNILMQFLSCFFSQGFVSVQVVHPYSSKDLVPPLEEIPIFLYIYIYMFGR